MRRILGAATIFISLWLPWVAFGQTDALTKGVGELADKLAFSRKGDVVGVEGDTLYISLGWQEGVLEGTRFEVVRLGEPLMIGDQILGYKETHVAEVEVIRAREKNAIAQVVRRSGDIEKGDRVYELRKKITRVAVTEFPFRDNFNALTRNVQDILYTTLIQKGITVVEREKLEEVLREQEIGTRGLIDLSTAAQMGKLLGVEAVVVGSISDLGNSLAILGRLVDVEKGVALSAARIELAKTPMLTDLAKTDIRRPGPPPVSPPPPGPPGPVAGQPHQATPADPRVANPLKETAAALVKRAVECFMYVTWKDEGAKQLIAEYNALVKKAKILLKSDPFIQTQGETGETGHYGANCAKVARLANELDIYLTSFVASQALKATAAALAKQGVEGRFVSYPGGDAAAKSLIAEYNLLVKKAKSLFKTDSFVQALEDARETGHPEANAANVADLAMKIETALAYFSAQ
jgi:TolB-like protein